MGTLCFIGAVLLTGQTGDGRYLSVNLVSAASTDIAVGKFEMENL